jgi:hypothetical protein
MTGEVVNRMATIASASMPLASRTILSIACSRDSASIFVLGDFPANQHPEHGQYVLADMPGPNGVAPHQAEGRGYFVVHEFVLCGDQHYWSISLE